MAKKNSEKLTNAMKSLKKRIESWRRGRPYRGSAMPESLWDEAVLVSRRFGIYPVSKELRINYGNLKQRMLAEKDPSVESSLMPDGFVEVCAVQPLRSASDGQQTSSVLELELFRADGTGLRLKKSGDGGLDVAHVVDAFCRGCR